MERPPKQLLKPPQSAERFLSWFCRDELLEEVRGDLLEFYQIERREKGYWKASLAYWYHVINFLRPFAIKRKRQHSTTIIMYRNYFKFAWRNMIKHKVSTAMNVLSLSVGMACFIFIFLYLKGELSYDKFHQDADRIYRVAIDFVDSNGRRIPDATTPPALAPALKRDFPEVAASVRLFPNWGSKFLIGVSENHRFYEEGLIRTDSTFFDVFSFPFIYGDPETALDNPDQLVITRSTARKYFGREDVVGETLTLFSFDEAKVRISGVIEDVPENSHFTFDFLSRITFRNIEERWGWYNFYTYMKLQEGSTIEGLEPKLQPFYESYVADEGETDTDYFNIIYSQPLTDIHLKSDLKWELEANGTMNNVYIFSALAIFVLLISCLNYLNLTVADSLKRLKEVGVRKVFGAQKHTLISQFIVEAVVIILLSLGIGSLFSEILFSQLSDLLGHNISIVDNENRSVFLTICAFALGVGILAGLYPAVYLSSFRVVHAVKGVFKRSGKSALGLRRGLLVVQFAISAFMIFGTIVVYRQLGHMKNSDMGFDMEQVLVIENGSAASHQKTLKAELMKIAAVSNAGFSSGVVGGLNWTTALGYPDAFIMNYVVGDPEYMESMDFEFVAGRNFSRSMATDTVGYTLIVNERGLKDLGLTLEDVGKPMPIYTDNDTIYNGTVIGVVRDFHFTNFKTEIKPFAFFYRQTPMDYLSVKLSAANITQALRKIEEVWTSVANGAPFDYFFLDESFATLHAQENKLSRILLYLTLLALFIAFTGMFAMANMTIKDKRKEIAIRKVLGASVSGVSAMITRKFMVLVLIANGIAGPLAYLLMQRWLDGFVYRTSPGVIVFVIVVLSTLLVAWLTVGYQSVRAAVKNPVYSLREE